MLEVYKMSGSLDDIHRDLSNFQDIPDKVKRTAIDTLLFIANQHNPVLVSITIHENSNVNTGPNYFMNINKLDITDYNSW